MVVVGEIKGPGDVFGQEPVQCGEVCRVATECSRKEKIGFAQGGLASRRKAKRPHMALLILPPFKKGSVGILLFKIRQAQAEVVPEALPAQRMLHARQRPTDWEGSPLVRGREAGEGSRRSECSWGWILRRAQPPALSRFLHVGRQNRKQEQVGAQVLVQSHRASAVGGKHGAGAHIRKNN